MKPKAPTRHAVLALLILLAVVGGARAQVVLDETALPDGDDEAMLEDAAGSPGFRVLVAAPRAAVIGRNAAVLLAARPGRVLHAEAGETIRFVSGVREAVWYRGAAAVGSDLALAGGPAGGPRSPIGQDSLLLPGSAPKIDRGLLRVDASFPQAGEYVVEAVVRAGILKRSGRIDGEARTVGYRVRVFEPGILGSISGSIATEEDGTPLKGYPVAAVDPATGAVLGAAATGWDGSYEILRLPPGSYLVVAPSRRGFQAEIYDDAVDPASASPVAVAAGAAVSGIDFTLSRP